MLGFTGTWQGHRVSVQGSGMGQPSMAIYVNELFREYDVQSIVRVGSCGGLVGEGGDPRRDHRLGSLHGLGSMNRITFEGFDYAPVADFGLLRAAVEAAEAADREAATHVGLIFSARLVFYASRPELMMRMVDYGVLGVEMEASALYTLAARYGRKALAVCTVSDHVVTGEETSADERERTFADMVDIALTAATQLGLSMPSSSARPGRSSGSTTRPLRTK